MYRSVNTRYLSEDYLLAVNNLLKKVHRNYVLPEELAGELNIDPSETDGVISELVNNEYAYPDDDGRIELSEYGGSKIFWKIKRLKRLCSTPMNIICRNSPKRN